MGPYPIYFFHPHPPSRFLDREAKVCELIGRDLHKWNKDLLEALFNIEEVKAIMSIPLSNTNRSDTII
jgi:hypothetical protein